MRITVLSGIALMCAATASAQTSAAATSQPNAPTTAASNAARTVTMTGCVGPASGSQGGYILSNPIVLPRSAQPGTPTAGISPSSSSATPGTQPSVGSGSETAGAVAGSPTAAGAGGAGTALGPTGTSGGATPGAAGAAGTAAAARSAINGYRLSGNDMSSWAGQRVQIVGMVIPTATGINASGVAASAGATGQTQPEFRVQSVEAITGNCPRQ